MSSVILTDPHNLTQPLLPHPDNLTLELSGTASIGIEEIRELIKWAHRKPFEKDSKKILIRQAQFLTEQAQNALLKILEEPPERTEITLSVSHPDHLLETVRSRCVVVSRRANSSTSEVKPKTSEVSLGALPLPSTIAEAFTTAEKLSKLERHEIIEELDKLILALREENLTKHWKNIKTISVAQQQVRENTNVKLALENMFLRLLS